jgi:hypothetical protein
MKKYLLPILAALIVAPIVYAYVVVEGDYIEYGTQMLGAPSQGIRYERSIIPEADSKFELGTSTKAWLRLNVDQLCLTGDSCQTAWPGAGTFAGVLNDISDVATTSTSYGELLMWNGTAWTNKSTTTLGITASDSFTLTAWYATTSAPQLTTLANLTDIGTIAKLDFTRASGTLISFTTAYGALQGSATDLTCTDCINATEIEDIYVLNTTDSMTKLTTTYASSTLTTISDTLFINQICNSAGECFDSPGTEGAAVSFYPNNNDSDIENYEKMLTVPTAGVTIDETCDADADVTNGYCLIDSYISSTSDIAILNYPAGTTKIHAYTYVSSAAGTSYLVFRGYRREADGTEHFLGQATTTEINALSVQEYVANFVGPTDTAFNADGTDRLVMKVYGWTDSTAARTLHWMYQSSGLYSHIVTPITSGDLGHARIYADETISGDWTHTGKLTMGYASSTGLTSTAIWGNLVGNVTGKLTGNASSTLISATTIWGSLQGSATDLTCTDCINATEIEDIYVLNTTDSMTKLTTTYASSTGITATTFWGALDGNAKTATALAADPADCAAGTVATAIAASGALTCGITPLISGGTLTTNNVCQYDGTGIDCNLTKDGSGDCASGAVCLGDHTHSSYLTAVASDATWTIHDSYPAACSAGQYVTAIGDTLTCSTPAGGGDFTLAAWYATTTKLNLNVGSVEGVDFGTLTDTKICVYDEANTEIDCNYTDLAGSGEGLSTSTPIADTYVIYGTGATTVGAEAAFTYDDSTNRLTASYASTTGLTATTIWGTNEYLTGKLGIGTTTLGSDTLRVIGDTSIYDGWVQIFGGYGFLIYDGAQSSFIQQDGADLNIESIYGDVNISAGKLTVTKASTTLITATTIWGSLVGASTDLTCTDCLNATEIEDIYLLTAGDSMTGKLTMTYASSTAITSTLFYGSLQGSATDLTCTDCINATEIEDIYILAAGDSMAGKLTMTNASSTNLTVSGTIWGTLQGSATDLTCTDCIGTTEISDSYLLNNGDVGTGGYDFGGADYLEIPNGTNPTCNDPGELCHDTSDNQLIIDDYVIGKATEKIWSVTVASSSRPFIDAGLLPVPVELDGYTITAIRCVVNGGTSKVIAIEDESANSTEDITCATSVTSDDGSITNATVTAAEEMFVDFGATSGSVQYVMISVFGQWTRE